MEGVIQTESTSHPCAFTKLLLAERRARAGRCHTETIVYIDYKILNINAEDTLDIEYHVHVE